MTSIRLKYVQAWVDRDGRVRQHFRRPGFPRTKLPGLPGSPEFMRAYEAALEGPCREIGSKRTKPGSLNVAIVGYYTSLEFRSLATGTQAMRRAILERFRRAHGDKPIALLPPKFIAHVLSTMKPFPPELAQDHPPPDAVLCHAGAMRQRSDAGHQTAEGKERRPSHLER